MESLIQPEQTWLLWAVVLIIAALGLWAETTKIGLKISGAVITILSGLVLSNVGVIPTKAPVYDVIWTYILPLSIPLILFEANIKRIIKESGRTLLGFVIGAVGTVSGAVVGFYLFELGNSADKLVAAFGAAYIGGTLNFVATAKATELGSSDLLAAGIASANLVVTVYLVGLFLLANSRLLENWLATSTNHHEDYTKQEITPTQIQTNATSILYAITISLVICALGHALENWFDWSGMAILSITVITVALATTYPDFFNRLRIGGQLGAVLLQIFFAAIGASASVYAIIEFGPALLFLAAFILITHFIFVIIGAKLLSLTLQETLVASNACAAGAPTAAAMAVSMRRPELILPGILCGTLGYAIGNFVGLSISKLFT